MTIKDFFAPTATRLGGARVRRAAMTLLMMLLTTTTAWADGLSGSGKEADPYLIASATDWTTFANADNAGTYWASGVYVKLTADIGTVQTPITTMAGTSSNMFKGTFIGDGHTLTVNYTATTNDCAPFLYIDGATINTLKVAGTISTGYKFAAGIAAHSYDDCIIQNCWSNVAISTTISGDGTHAGFVAVQEGGSLNITNCLFDGSITGSTTTNCGGMVGWRKATLKFKNCMMAGTMDISQTNGSSLFSRNVNPTLSNSYYDGSKNYGSITVQGEETTATGEALRKKLGSQWVVIGDKVIPILSSRNLANATVSDVNTSYSYTGSDISITPVVTDANGTTLTLDTDYTVTIKKGDDVVTSVTAVGDYTLTIAGTGTESNGYYGSKNIAFYVTGEISGSGTISSPYLIGSVADWIQFANPDNADTYWESGVCVKLTADIGTAQTPITTMAGTNDIKFKGTFFGDEHTLTVNYTGTSYVAPFCNVDGATIQDLVVEGTISSSDTRAAGVIGETGSTTSHIINCVSSSTISGGNYTGGFSIGGNVVIEGCVFNGKINGSSQSGGFVGYSHSKLKITNSLFAPKDGSSISGGTFYFNGGGDITPTNSYYTTALGTAQGKRLRSITAGENVTLNHAGEPTTYSVSGITAYKATNACGDSDPFIAGIVYNDVLYAGSGDAVSLTLTNDAPGYEYGYSANAGTLSGSSNPYKLTMTDADVTITATLTVSYTYIDADGTQKSHTAAMLTSDMDVSELSSGWYVVMNSNTDPDNDGGVDVRYSSQFYCTGDCYLILCDGAEMAVSESNKRAIWVNGGRLTIYGQTAGTGKLTVSSTTSEGISANNVTINGGVIDVNAQSGGIYAQSSININGGQVTAISTGSISGLSVGSSYNTITLGWRSATDCITASSYGGPVTIADGKVFEDETTGICYKGTLTNAEKNAIKGHTLAPCTETLYDITLSAPAYVITADRRYAKVGQTVVLTPNNTTYFTLTSVSCNGSELTPDGEGKYSFEMPAESATITVTYTSPFGTGDGSSAETAFVISNATGWDTFCAVVNDNIADLRGKYWRLGGDIPSATDVANGTEAVTTMAGTSTTKDFSGTFDGDGHTLTVGYNVSEINCAPFRFIEDATITNLHVAGTIQTSKMNAAGIVGFVLSGTNTITNCRSSVTINSSSSGRGNHGGLVAAILYNTAIEGCVFDGKIVSTGESATTYCSGFVGLWYKLGTLTITNSLYAPTADDNAVISGATFSNNGGTITNCYYTQPLGTAQGKQLRSITAGENVTLNHAGVATEYSVSGITAYKATNASGDSDPFIAGIVYNDVLYAGSGDAVSLTLANNAPDAPGYHYVYTASAGTLSGTTLTMPDANVTVSGAIALIDWATVNAGTQADPYMIYDKDQLLLLAQRVNSGTGDDYAASGYEGKYFQLGADIVFIHPDIEDDNYEENYEAIGRYDGNWRYFKGTFDGDDYTVSGIRIRKTGTSTSDKYQGLFGIIREADVHDVHVTDARIKGYDCIGGIVGSKPLSTVSGCTVTETTITATSTNNDYGAICGESTSGTLSHNYYHGCTVNGSAVTSNDVTANDGAVPMPVLSDTEDNTAALATLANRGNQGLPTTYPVILSGRTLYRDGDWNTLCLPFNLGNDNADEGHHFDGTPLEGATVKELLTTSNLAANGTLTLNFTDASSIEAGKPYIVKWETTGANITNPMFTDVTISSTDPEPVVSNDSKVTFVGQYSLFAIDETNINSVIMLSSGNRLGYSNATRTLRPFRAHFEVPGENPVRNFVLDFDGETTSMHNAECLIHNWADAWYSLDGRKLDNVPTKKGLYIHGGKKVAIK